MCCQLGQVGRTAERSGGVGKKVSKYEAGCARGEWKTRNILKHDGRRAWAAEQSNGKVSVSKF